MKKIITSLGMIVFAVALVASGTGAFFSDTETSTGNVFTAGAIDLKVDSVAHINGLVCFGGQWTDEDIIEWVPEDGDVPAHLALKPGEDIDAANTAYNNVFPANVPQAGDECGGTWDLTDLGPLNVFFDYGDLKPGDNGENTISLHVNNNDAYMCAIIENVEDLDNNQTEPELEDGDDNGVEGELDSELNFFIWEDDGDNIFQDNENVLVQNSNGENIEGVYPLYTPATEAFPGGETKYLGVYWCYGTFDGVGNCDGGPVTNISQTDSLKADITFQIEQARNNENFRCVDRDVQPDLVWNDDGTRTGGVAELVEVGGVGTVLQLTTIDDVDSRVRYNFDVEDVRLDSFTGFSYDSNQVSAFDLVNGNASFRLVVDLDGVTTKEITFEPYYNIFAENSLNAPAILTGVWQTWTANLANGKFWVNGLLVDGKDSSGGGSYANNFTLNQLLVEYPNAEIIGISIGMGTYNKDQVVQVDNLTFNGTNLGF